jgi:DNA invertase Pin-like site-specific DNA recombinase
MFHFLTAVTGFETIPSLLFMLIGYARVSTSGQTLALQQDALTQAGCEKLFSDTASGSRTDRSGLEAALSFARPGNTVVVWRLDRLGRSVPHLIETVNQLKERGIQFRSLQEHIDTSSSGGKLIFHVFAAITEMERDLIRERTHASLAAARARGRKGGGRRLLSPKQVAQLRTLAADKDNAVKDICSTLKISRPTFYRYVKS